MARIVRLEEGDLALDLFLRNLAEHTFREMMLKLTEGGHAIVDAIKQDENGDAGQRPTAKSNQEALDQARAGPKPVALPFP